MSESIGKGPFSVVINHEEQYAIWPVGREVPSGWKRIGKQGSKDACIAHIEEVWTDMRPMSVAKAVEERTRKLLANQKG